ncbi:hypothetical protein LTR78_000159 [Recurvomyces mirabilis]|uniref:Uncharacterized protein n=1 Tax=Recurvomyces mirabilis TaxID=574656 RepID=A0AAE0WXG4_9PEZI|nr:hypothetical protein LTR78_000159 [Recurvomyces mirabilis]
MRDSKERFVHVPTNRPHQRLCVAKEPAVPYLTPPTPIVLSSPNAILAKQVGLRFEDFYLKHSWFAYVPRYVGYSATIDASARAAVSALESYFHRTATSARQATRSRGEALTVLRTNLDSSDASLMSVGLLIFAGGVVANFDIVQQAPHLDGLRAIVAARTPDTRLSDFGRYLIWQSVDKDFLLACGVGKASGWDRQSWDGLNFSTPSATTEVATIQGLMTRLAIKVPRAIAAVRAVRGETTARYRSANSINARQLVDQLLGLVDSDAENTLLHRVKITSTPASQTKRAIMPTTYSFETLDQFVAAIHYWYLRLIAIKLQLTLYTIEPGVLSDPSLPTSKTNTRAEHLTSLQAEQTRLTANIIMSWQTKHSNVIDPKCRQIALLVIWNALADMSIFRSMPSSLVRSWVLQAYQDLHAGAEISAQNMGDTAGLFAGGPRIGMLALEAAATTASTISDEQERIIETGSLQTVVLR